MATTNNQKYIERGRDMAIKSDPNWKKEVEDANRGKTGAPFKYSDNMIKKIFELKVLFGEAYRPLVGFLQVMLDCEIPDPGTISRRLTKLGIDPNSRQYA